MFESFKCARGERQNGAIIELFADVPSCYIFSFPFPDFWADKELVHSEWRMLWIKTDCFDYTFYFRVKKRGRVLMKESDENKHCNSALIKHRTVAFHFHCPRTYSSAYWYMTGLHTVLSNNSWNFSISCSSPFFIHWSNWTAGTFWRC